ncbi:MAG: T9SS type A sorting domain-containing protein, partial [Calditrichaeota bacterium]|nr:T9SS type A sorting domain-containing protein [Calditrichota bacterium]
QYTLPEASPVSIKLYNISGSLVSSLLNSQKTAGIHTTTLTSNTIPAGLYLIQMTTPTFSTMRKVILVK